jgi:general secretion pathway protein D
MRIRTAFSAPVLAAILVLGSLPVAGQNLTETKVRLMEDALAARDHGQYAVAKGKLEALQSIAPNDPEVRRILADVSAKLAAQQAAAAAAPPVAPAEPASAATLVSARTEPVPVAATTAAAKPEAIVAAAGLDAPEPARIPAGPGQVVMPVVRDEKPDVPVAPEAGTAKKVSPEAAAAEAAAEALLHADDDQLSKLVAYVQAQRALARALAREKNYAAAIAALDAALTALQRPVDDLEAELSEYVQEQKAADDSGMVKLRHRH